MDVVAYGSFPPAPANALGEVAADVSRRLEERDESGDPAPIRNLPGCVFHAFVRHLNRLKRKELVLVRDDGTGQALSSRWGDPSAQFETKILVDESLAQCDSVTRDMFWRRVQGFTWEEIGKIHRLSAHTAEVRFRHAIRAAAERLTNERRSLPRRTPADSIEEPKPAMLTDAKKQTTGI